MENQLTGRPDVPYSVRRIVMDENIDAKEPLKDVSAKRVEKPEESREEKAKKVAELSRALSIKKELARKAWAEENKKIEASGQKIPEEVKKAQAELIEKGLGPIGGGSSDGYFEHFPTDKYKDSKLKDIANELKRLGQNSEVTDEKLEEITEQVRGMQGTGMVSDDVGNEFIEDVSKTKVKKEKGEEMTSTIRNDTSSARETVGPTLNFDEANKYSEFNAELFVGSPLEDIARRIKNVGMGSTEDTSKIMHDYNAIKNDLPLSLRTQYDDEIRRVQEEAQPKNTPNNFLEKYKDKPQLLDIIQQIEGLKAINQLDQRVLERQKQRVIQMMQEGQITREEAVDFLKDMDIVGELEQPKERVQRNSITSIQDVAKIIINDEGEDRWGSIDGSPSDAVYPLLEKGEKGKLKINKANFIQWARERTMYHHTNNPRDFNLQITQLVGVDNDFGSTISVFTMDKNRNKYFKDEESGRIMDDLAEQLKTEVWLFGSMRNYDIIYKEYMGQDSKLPEFLTNVHNKEELTSGDSLERIVTLSEKFLGSDTDETKKQDTNVGDAARKAYEIYYYMSDLKKLREILGEKSIFFKKEGLINVFKILEGKSHTDAIDPVNLDRIQKLFNADGSIKESEFIQFINPFNDQNKPDININITRELVRQAIAEKYNLEYGLEKRVKEERTPSGKYRAPERAFLRINTEYAETWAWILSRFTGAAARNDTQSIGFDAFTKTMQFMKYRLRQSSASRAGQFGNEYNLGVFKTLTLDFFNGVWVRQGFDEKGRTTPFELMLKIDEEDKKIDAIKDGKKEEELNDEQIAQIESIQDIKRGLAKKFRFDQSTQKGYAANHLGKAFEIFHNMLGNEELRLDQMVKYEQFGLYQGRYVIDRTKFEEALKEKFIKPVRYAFSTYPMIDFAKETRELVSLGNNDKLPVYKTTTVAENIFGPIVTGEFKKNAVKLKKEFLHHKIKEAKKNGKNKDDVLTEGEKKILKQKRFNGEEKEEIWRDLLTKDLRPQLWKRAVMARIAKDLLSHRIRAKNNQYEYMHHEQVELFLHALENIPSVEVFGEDEEDLKFAYGEKFLNEEDMEWIKKESRTTEGRMFMQDIAPSIAGGFAKGIFEGIGDFFKGSLK